MGIATTTPIQKLDVAGTAQLRGVAGGTGLYVNSSGNVGIGTTDPGTRKLKVNGNVEATSYYGDGSNLTGISGLPSGTQGDILYYNGTTWVVLAPGLKGQTLKTQGTGANPIWAGTGTEPTWTVNYDGSVLPTAATPAWTTQQAGTPLLSSDGNIFDFNTTSGASTYVYYWHGIAGKPWYDNVSSATGWTLEIRAKIISSSVAQTARLAPSDGSYYSNIDFYADKVALGGYTSLTYTMNTTDDYHVYRFTGQGNNFKLYVDGVLKLTNTDMYTTGVKSLTWYNGYSCQWYIDYLKYYTGGAISPEF